VQSGTIALLVKNVQELAEAGQFAQAVALYEAARPGIPNDFPKIREMDEIVGRFKTRAGVQAK
jgi:hypothetical protein